MAASRSRRNFPCTPRARHAAQDRRETLAILPENQRRVVELLKLNGLSIRETAKKLDMSEAAVKVTAHRAYLKLRKSLESETNGHA